MRTTAQPLGEAFWGDPLVRALSADLVGITRADPLLDFRGALRTLQPELTTGQTAVTNMRQFNRILHSAAFAAAVDRVNQRVADAPGVPVSSPSVAISEIPGPVPQVGAARAVDASGLLVRRSRRAIGRILGRLARRS